MAWCRWPWLWRLGLRSEHVRCRREGALSATDAHGNSASASCCIRDSRHGMSSFARSRRCGERRGWPSCVQKRDTLELQERREMTRTIVFVAVSPTPNTSFVELKVPVYLHCLYSQCTKNTCTSKPPPQNLVRVCACGQTRRGTLPAAAPPWPVHRVLVVLACYPTCLLYIHAHAMLFAP